MIYSYRDAHVAISAVENVLMICWLGPPNLASATAFERATRTLASQYPAGVAHINVVAKTTSPTSFEDAARKRFVAMLHDPSLPLVASVTLYGDGGFVAAAIRGVLAGLAMLSRIPVKIRVVARADEAEGFVRDALQAANASAPAPGLLADAAHSIIDDAVRDGLAF